MSLGDFCALTPDEFGLVCKAYADSHEAEYKDGWERMRMLATIVIQPHIRQKITPQRLMPLPWEKVHKNTERSVVSKDEDMERLRTVMKKVGNNRGGRYSSPSSS